MVPLLPLVLIVIVCIPRFNTNDYLIGRLVGKGMAKDSTQYIAMVDVYKGESSSFQPKAPFTYRPLIPLLAAKLPFDSMTALNVLNISFLWLGAIALTLLLLDQSIPVSKILVGSALYCVSFPVFFYGPIGCVDPAVMGMLSFGLYLLYRHQWLGLAVVIFAGGFIKETIVLLIPVTFLYLVTRKFGIAKTLLLSSCLFAAYIISILLAHVSLDPNQVVRQGSVGTAIYNLSRPKTWLSLIGGAIYLQIT